MPFTPYLTDNDEVCYSFLIFFIIFTIYMCCIIFINLNIFFNDYQKIEEAYIKMRFKYQSLKVDFDEYIQEQEYLHQNQLFEKCNNDENKENYDDLKKNN
jgi:hypothetical protein